MWANREILKKGVLRDSCMLETQQSQTEKNDSTDLKMTVFDGWGHRMSTSGTHELPQFNCVTLMQGHVLVGAWMYSRVQYPSAPRANYLETIR